MAAKIASLVASDPAHAVTLYETVLAAAHAKAEEFDEQIVPGRDSSAFDSGPIREAVELRSGGGEAAAIRLGDVRARTPWEDRREK